MTTALHPRPATHPIRCEICGNAIHHPDALFIADPTYPVCRSFECRNLLRQKSGMTTTMFKTHIEFKRKVNTERVAREALNWADALMLTLDSDMRTAES